MSPLNRSESRRYLSNVQTGDKVSAHGKYTYTKSLVSVLSDTKRYGSPRISSNMLRRRHFFWTVLFSVFVICSAENRNHSRKRQLRQFLLETDEDLLPRAENSTSYRISRPKFDPRWFTALSKIARIRTADGRSWNISDPKQKKVDYLLEEFSKRKVEFERNKDGLTVSSVHFRPRKFHCQPIQDTYVPKANRTLPAYMCKLGSRHFVLTSERFLHDRRSHVDVNIDEATFLKLTPDDRTANQSTAEVISATLVFNEKHNDYGIKRT